jgi:hypothetical protein
MSDEQTTDETLDQVIAAVKPMVQGVEVSAANVVDILTKMRAAMQSQAEQLHLTEQLLAKKLGR